MVFKPTDVQTQIYLNYAKRNLPRHTSYPIAPAWKDSFTSKDHEFHLVELGKSPDKSASLYFHIPYCQQLCFYCGCTKEIVGTDPQKNTDLGDRYLDNLKKEVELTTQQSGALQVDQIHLGGGSPTFLSASQLERLFRLISTHFKVSENAEIAIEVDPRITTHDQILTLKKLGFNRLSMGIQDFDDRVQKAVNRIQSYEQVQALVEHSRSVGFDAINFDLIYGLPYQTKESMEATLDKVLSLSPDRIAFYRLAMIPEMFKWQRTFTSKDMPEGDLVLDLFVLAYNKFLQNSYEYIGFDHFAKRSEGLSKALQNGTITRNFQGITTGKNLPIIGFGPSAISNFLKAYSQNLKTVREWENVISHGKLPVCRGIQLTNDDLIRSEALQDLYCLGHIDMKKIENDFSINFKDYFSKELKTISSLEPEIVDINDQKISLKSPFGRLLSRVVAAEFDPYFAELIKNSKSKFSSVG